MSRSAYTHSSLANVLCILLLPVACLAAEQQKVVLPSASQLGANEVNWDALRVRDVRQLVAGSTLTKQALIVDQDTARYALAGLQADTPYEVLVSYPGTIPVDVRVRFSRKQRSGTAGSRKLLDTEKLEFRTDAAGLAVAELTADARGAPVVLVSAHSSGALPRGLSPGGGVLVFDIRLSPLEHGLPSDALQLRSWLAVCAACALLLSLCCVPVGVEFHKHPAHRWTQKRRRVVTHTED